MNKPGIDNKPFDLRLVKDVFKKGDLLTPPVNPLELIYNREFLNKFINWFLGVIGFNVGYEMEVLNEGIPVGEGYEFKVQLKYKVISWFSFKLYKVKIC
jgi:hypothetical protein